MVNGQLVIEEWENGDRSIMETLKTEEEESREKVAGGSVTAGFLGLPESTADVSSLHLYPPPPPMLTHLV